MRMISLVRTALFSLAVCAVVNGCAPKVEESEPLHGAATRAPESSAKGGLRGVPALEQASEEGRAAKPGDTAAVVPVKMNPDVASAPVPVPSGPSIVDYSLPVEFTVRASVMGWDTVNLRSYPISVDNGFAFSGLLEGGAGGGSPRSFDITRFAHFGDCDSPYIFKWVLYMPETGELSYSSGRATGGKKEITLKGKLNFDIILKSATKALEMRAKMVPVFRGTANAWPPNTMTFTLANGPIPFYKIDRLNDSGAHPMLTVLEAKYVVGKGATKFFTVRPKIIRTTGGKGKGAQLEWTGTADQLKASAISGYAIYRSADPSDPKSWRQIATVPATQTSYADTDYSGRAPVAYAVAHRTEYPPFYNYEGMLSDPVVFDPAVQ